MTEEAKKYVFRSIGVIRTPYDPGFTPDQPVARDESESRLELHPHLAPALADLDRFRYVYVLFLMDGSNEGGEPDLTVAPPWAGGRSVGLLASRCPARPNPIGLSVVRLKRVEGATIVTSAVDAYDGTILLDVKPYIREIDSKDDSDLGWLDDLAGGGEHVVSHLRGVPHNHGHGRGQGCGYGNNRHGRDHEHDRHDHHEHDGHHDHDERNDHGDNHDHHDLHQDHGVAPGTPGRGR